MLKCKQGKSTLENKIKKWCHCCALTDKDQHKRPHVLLPPCASAGKFNLFFLFSFAGGGTLDIFCLAQTAFLFGSHRPPVVSVFLGGQGACAHVEMYSFVGQRL